MNARRGHPYVRRIHTGEVCDQCGRIPGDGELIRNHRRAWICRVCAYPAGGAPEDEDGNGPTRNPLPEPQWPLCGCGNRILLARPGRTRCARCEPMIFRLPPTREETPMPDPVPTAERSRT